MERSHGIKALREQCPEICSPQFKPIHSFKKYSSIVRRSQILDQTLRVQEHSKADMVPDLLEQAANSETNISQSHE